MFSDLINNSYYLVFYGVVLGSVLTSWIFKFIPESKKYNNNKVLSLFKKRNKSDFAKLFQLLKDFDYNYEQDYDNWAVKDIVKQKELINKEFVKAYDNLYSECFMINDKKSNLIKEFLDYFNKSPQDHFYIITPIFKSKDEFLQNKNTIENLIKKIFT